MSSFIFDKCVRITATFVCVWAYGQEDIIKGVAIGPKSPLKNLPKDQPKNQLYNWTKNWPKDKNPST